MEGDNELEIADDIEASGYFNLAVLNNGVTARVCEPFEVPSAPRTSLFAISNIFGWAVAATGTGFSLISLDGLRGTYQSASQRTTPSVNVHKNVEVGNGGLTFLKIGMAEKVVIAAGPALQGGVGVWRLKSLVDGSNTSPLHVFPAASDTPLLDVLPNPGDRPELLALLHQDGQVTMINMEAKTTIGRFGSNVSAACWSVKGKQIVCGDQQGNLTQYTPEGDARTVTQAPTSLRGRAMAAIDIRWVENTVFFVTYIDPSNPMDTSVFISTRAKDGSVTYAPILDPLMVENPDRNEARFNTWLKNWSPFKHLLLVCNATSNTISHVGLAPTEEGGSEAVWSQVKNDLYTTLPLETFPLGLEVDLTATEPPLPAENAGEIPTPMLWAYATDGTLSAWRIVNRQGGQYAGIAAAQDITVNEEAGSTQAGSSTSNTATVAPAVTASPFSDPTSRPAFGNAGFGSKSFSSPSSAFGGSSAFSKSTFAPAFGQQPTFGSSTSGAAFGQSSAFGKAASGANSAFGSPAPAHIASTPSTTGGGFSGFSSQSTGFGAAASSSTSSSPFAPAASTPPTTSAFGTTTTPTFGSTSAFGQTSKPASGTSSPFGGMSLANTPTTEQPPKPVFGASSAFGSSIGATFGSLGFGNATSGASPFGNAASKTPAKVPASGGFGAFGDSSKSSGFGAFGSSSANTGATGFSFGKAAAPTSAPNAFGQKPVASFGGLRDAGDNGGSNASGAAIKPAGLNDDDAEALEPTIVSTQSGGALDFGGNDDDAKSDKSEDAGTLKMDGFGFGTPSSPTVPRVSPALFGTSGKVAGNVKTYEERRRSMDSPPPKPIAATTSAFGKPATLGSGFGAFGQSTGSAFGGPQTEEKPDVEQQKKPAFSFAKPAEMTGEKPIEEKKPAFSFLPKPAESEKKEQPAPAPGFGFSGFGQTAKPGEAKDDDKTGTPAAKPSGFSGFGQASPLGKSDGKPTFSFGKPAANSDSSGGAAIKPTGFSAFASSSPGAASPFASSTSSSTTSPFGSPANTATKSPFGQPGFFSGFGQKKQEKNDKKDSQTTSEKTENKSAPTIKSAFGTSTAVPSASTSNAENRFTELTGGEDDEEAEKDGNEDETENQDEIYDEEDGAEEAGEEEDQEAAEVEDDEEGDQDEGGSSEAEEVYDDEEDEEDQEGEEEDDGQNANETNVDLTPASEPPASDGAESRELSRSPSPSPTPTQPAVMKQEEKSAAATSEAPKPAASPAFSFSTAPKSTEMSEASKSAPSFSFAKPATTDLKTDSPAPPAKKEEAPKATSAFENSSSSASSFSLTSSASQSKSAELQQLPKPFGFSNLQKAAPRTSSPLASMPSFAPSAQNSQTSFELSSSSFSAAGGPSDASAFTASPSKSFGQPNTPTGKQATAMPSFLNNHTKKEEEKSQQSTTTPKAIEQKARPQLEHRKSDTSLGALNMTVPPKLSSNPSQDRVRQQQQQQVSKDTVNVFMTMQDQLTALKDSVSQCMDFFHSVQPARLPKPIEGQEPVDPLEYEAEVWSMGDLPRLKEIGDKLAEEVKELTQRGGDGEKAAKSLEGSLLKTKAKTEEISRHLKAKQDPHVARLVKVRQLGPEQLENQTRIRHLNQGVNEALEELEGVITLLREKVLEKKMGRTPMKAPSLDSIHRAMRNMTAALQRRLMELDDMALSLDMLTLSTGSPGAGMKKTPQRIRAASEGPDSSPGQDGSSTPTRRPSTQHSTEREKKVERLLAAEVFGQRLKNAWLANGRTEPLLNTSANVPLSRS